MELRKVCKVGVVFEGCPHLESASLRQLINENKTTYCPTVQLRPIRRRKLLLDAVFPADLIDFPPFSSLASSDRIISEMPYKRMSVSHCSSLSDVSAILRRKYSHDIRVLSSRKIMAYWLPPFDFRAFLPLRSTKTLSSFSFERHSLVRRPLNRRGVTSMP